MFRCIVCGNNGNPKETGFRPRDRKELNIVDCPACGHRQLFPLLSEEESVERTRLYGPINEEPLFLI